MNHETLIPQLEALLFTYGEPMAVKRIAQTLSISENDARAGLDLLRAECNRTERGLALLEKNNVFQLVTKPDFSRFLEDIVKSEFTEELTPAALEALSIICYTSPVTRAEIDYVRGVNSSFILRSLTLRGLVERRNEPKRGNAYVYSPSFDFLKHLGLSRIEELPEFEHFHGLIRTYQEEQHEAMTHEETPANHE